MNYSTLAKSHMPAQNVTREINKSIKLKHISAPKYVLQNSGLPLSSGQFPGDQKVHYCEGPLYMEKELASLITQRWLEKKVTPKVGHMHPLSFANQFPEQFYKRTFK